MGSAALDVVMAHLRDLAKRGMATAALPVSQRLAKQRELTETYFHADPSILELRAEPKPVTVAGRAGEWLRTTSSRQDYRLLFLHGGSWMKGGLASHRAFASRIAEATGYAVLTIDYRLAPEHPFPLGLEDCVAAYQWLRDHGPEGASPAGRTIIAGDSAGGNLALASLLVLKERGIPAPDAAMAFSPPTDFACRGESMRTRAAADPILHPFGMPLCAKHYLQKKVELTHPWASPLYGDLADLPQILLQVGDAEILLDDSTRFAAAASAVGVNVELQVWPEMPHVFQGFAPFLPEANVAFNKMAEFTRSLLTAKEQQPWT